MVGTVGANITSTYTATTLQNSGGGWGVGDHWQGPDGKVYKFVKFNNGVGNVAPIVGDCAYYYAVSGASAGQITEVTMDLTDSGGVGAGVFQSIPADGEYCWLQIKGPATLTTALLAGADGNALTAVGATTDGTLDVSALVTDAIIGYAIDASAKIIMCDFPW